MIPDSSYLAHLLQWANVFISFFIMIFAYIFFKKSKPHKNRTPWIFLFVAVISFFVFELSGAILDNQTIIPELRDFFKTIFIAFILYVFIYQHYLLMHSNKIVIEKKESEKK
ncbi:MAG: hypothetical protein WC758_06800 [Candidatus Woesearchaeota archaeon]|jgi:amino acid transporter